MTAEQDTWLPIPDALARAYSDRHWELVWQYRNHSLVYRLSGGATDDFFLKLTPADHYPSPIGEADRMRWARQFLPVPKVLASGISDQTAWLATSVLPGNDGTAPGHLARPDELVRTLAAGLRQFHDSAPVADCPFDFRLDAALGHISDRLAAGLIDAARDFHPEYRHLSVDEAAAILVSSRPRSEDLVVCHGDYCPPNILIDDWTVKGFVDLGELGVADRWWDLAPATWSVTWNLGPGFEELFLAEYGATLDPDRRAYYRLMYDLAC